MCRRGDMRALAATPLVRPWTRRRPDGLAPRVEGVNEAKEVKQVQPLALVAVCLRIARVERVHVGEEVEEVEGAVFSEVGVARGGRQAELPGLVVTEIAAEK